MIPKHTNFTLVQANGNIPRYYMPDGCFAYIDSHGKRWLPHHFTDGTLDIPRLQRMIIEVKKSWHWLSNPDYQKVLDHLEQHLKNFNYGIGKDYGACKNCASYPCSVFPSPNPNEPHWCAGFLPNAGGATQLEANEKSQFEKEIEEIRNNTAEMIINVLGRIDKLLSQDEENKAKALLDAIELIKNDAKGSKRWVEINQTLEMLHDKIEVNRNLFKERGGR